MKRFSIFFAALFVAVTSFAAVTYELNGGVTNDDNWLGKGDMFAAFMTDAGVSSFETLEYYMQQADPLSSPNICAALTDASPALKMEKWAWLKAYVEAAHAAQAADGASALPADGTGAAWRYAVGAFFISGQRAGWPKSADFSSLGLPAAFMPSWKHAFANPTEPTAEFVLNAPYKEGYTFDGWYAAADFSGEKVTKIDATTTGTLYAKWVEYIPTIAEVKALANDAETKVAGVVNFISGKNIYIQDATGGVLVYTNETPTCTVGQKIVAKGVKVIYGGAPEVKSAVVESAEAGELATPLSFENLAALCADSVEFKHFATRVCVPGVKIVSYDSYNNPTVEDALGNKAVCYKMVLDPVTFPIGTKVTVTGVAGWFNGFQFVGDAAGIEIVVIGKKEQFDYPERQGGRFNLENNWVISNMEDNFAANKPGGTQYVRGMAAKDGIMYFINRETESIVRVDGKTGEMLDPIKIKGDHLFQKVTGTDSITGEKTYAAGTTLPFNDIKFDQAGNCLIGACISASTACQPFFIYVVDLETGEATELINDVLWDNTQLTGKDTLSLDSIAFRFDAFGVAGDVTKNGVVMAADANGSWNVYRWLITDGKAAQGEQVAVLIDPAVDKSLYVNAAGFGGAPQIFPQSEDGTLFYVDGFNTVPMLFYGDPQEGAKIIDDFINVQAGTKVWNNDTTSLGTGPNGLVEFQVGEEYFLLMVATNTDGKPTSSFALYQFADEDRAFEGMRPLWYFPHNGLGGASNQCRTAVPSVEVKSDTEAILYIYVPENGYASYTLTINPSVVGFENVETEVIGVEKYIENGQLYIIKNGVKYNVLGAQVK